MPVPDSYFNTTGNIEKIFGAIQSAGVPERFTHQFLKQLGFNSSNDRAVIPVMKALRFLDENSTPTERYKRYRDRGIAGAVMAEALRDAYGDIFTVNENAHTLPSSQAADAFKRVTNKGDAVAKKMATTFRALSKLADWSGSAVANEVESAMVEAGPREAEASEDDRSAGGTRAGTFSLRHDIHVHLPVSTEVKVYDAIFRSLREHF